MKKRLNIILFLLSTTIIYSQSLFELDKNEFISLDSIKTKLNSGANINEINDHGETFLMQYCSSDNINLEIVKYFINHGYDRSYTNKANHNNNLLMYAVAGNNPNLVKLLLENGFDIHYRNDLGWTPIHITMFFNTFRFIQESENEILTLKLLLEYGADPNSRDNDGKTPLMMSYLNQCPDIVFLLLKAGANPELTDKRNRNAEEFLSTFGSKGLLRQEKLILLKYFTTERLPNNVSIISTLPNNWKERLSNKKYLRDKILEYNLVRYKLSIDDLEYLQSYMLDSDDEIDQKINLQRVENAILFIKNTK